MEPFLNYLKKRGGIVNHHIQRGNVPSDEQLANFTKETVAKFKELARSAPDEVRRRIMLSWAPFWDYEQNAPGKGDMKLDALKLLDILKKIKDDLSTVQNKSPACQDPVNKCQRTSASIKKAIGRCSDCGVCTCSKCGYYCSPVGSTCKSPFRLSVKAVTDTRNGRYGHP